MDLNKKQRLIGIFVLIAVALIAIPSLFEFTYKKSSDNQLSSNIPIEPHTPEVAINQSNENEIDLSELDDFEVNEATANKPPVVEANLDTAELNSVGTDAAQPKENPTTPKTINVAGDEELIIPQAHKVEAVKPVTPPAPVTEKIEAVKPINPPAPVINKVVSVKPIAITPVANVPKPKPKVAQHEQKTSTKTKKFVSTKYTTSKQRIISETPKRTTTQTKLVRLKKPNIIVEPKAVIKKPETWALQLGSFSNKDNASKLISSLRKKGLSAYSVDTYGQSNTSTRVYVGPYTDKLKANKVVHQLTDEFHINAIVVRNQV